ncbi:hypothetical protein BCR44DRAFT_210907 [Catenaria anguillulae PL171]|uniref:Uncharacterized protein n=1 Tax=Catenaria anguillulae PL171 TaxID=765915 RepID=A0A1Y2HZW9_9FUNG|nr:hypothetical protein BCR44DRAFT_210907 [Catenaria anguillulae PL171]
MCVATQHGAMTWLKVIVGTFMVLDNSNTDAFFGFDLFDAKDFADPYIQVNDYAVKLEHVLLPPICTYANVIGHMASGVMPCDLRAGVVKVLCNVTPKRHGQDLATVFKLSVLLPAALSPLCNCPIKRSASESAAPSGDCEEIVSWKKARVQ